MLTALMKTLRIRARPPYRLSNIYVIASGTWALVGVALMIWVL